QRPCSGVTDRGHPPGGAYSGTISRSQRTTTASCCRMIRIRYCHVRPGSPGTLIDPRRPTDASRISSRSFPSGPRPEGLLLLQLPLQLPHEARQACTALALEPLGFQDRLDLGERFVDIVIDDDVVVFGPMAQFMAGAAHAPANHLIRI